MPDQLIIEWSIDRLSLLTVGEDGGVRIAAERIATDHADSSVLPDQAATALRTWLDQQGTVRGKVTVVLPREAIVLRRLEIPQAPDDEIPDLVRFQAATKISTPIEDLALDFLMVSSSDPEVGQSVITLTIERKRLSRIIEVLEAAGLTVGSITTSSLTVANLVRHSGHPQLGISQPELIVHQQGERIEFSVLDRGTLVLSHVLLLPETSSSEARLRPLQSELSRSLISLGQFHPGTVIGGCYYLGTGEDAVVTFLESRFPGKVTTMDAASLMRGGRAGFEPLMGAAIPEPDQRLSIDFLHPRQRREVKDRTRFYLAGAGGAVVLLLLISYGLFRSQMNTLEASLESLEQQRLDLEQQLQTGQPRLEAHDRIARWARAQADPILLWHEVRQHLPGTDRLYLAELRFAPQSGDSLARFTGTGFARQRSDVDEMYQSLAENGFRVTPQATRTSGRDPDYPIQFELDVELLRDQPVTETASTGEPQRG